MRECCSDGTCEELEFGELELIAEYKALGRWNDDNRERKRKIRRELANLRVASSPRHEPTQLPDGRGPTSPK